MELLEYLKHINLQDEENKMKKIQYQLLMK